MVERLIGKNKPGSERVALREFLWEQGRVTPGNRAQRNRHKGKWVLFIGDDPRTQKLAKDLEYKLFNNRLQSYYLGLSSLTEGLEADIGESFWDREEHIRRLGELGRILTDAGLIFISSLERVDDYDLTRLKELNSPNELLVIAIGESAVDQRHINLQLGSDGETAGLIKQIEAELDRHTGLPEYTI
jgi:bifunctional enzyme CysN/CysC